MYGVRSPDPQLQRHGIFRRKRDLSLADLPPGIAVQLENIVKLYSTKRFGVFGRGKPVVAIKDLSFSVPRGEIFCLLGRNGAAKSTTLSAMARLVPISGGSIRYAEDLHLGIASQRDILWDELDCKQVR